MSISPDIRGWRLKGLRLGKQLDWAQVIERYNRKELNPQLSLAHYLSNLTDNELLEIHDRKKAGMEEQVIFERKK